MKRMGEIKVMLGLLNRDKLFVGYDIGNEYAQISCTFPESEDVRTLSFVAGEQSYSIPAVLCKKKGSNQWFYGKEALRCAQDQEGILVQNLLDMAIEKETVQIEGNSYEPAALLALFLKRSMGILSQIASIEKISALTFTCERLEQKTLEALEQAVAGLGLKTQQVFFESHMESYYNYMLYQPEELWKDGCALFDYRGNRILSYRMERNTKTTPIAVFTGEKEYPFASYEPMPEDQELRERRMERLDQEFLKIAEDTPGLGRMNSFFLIGENFSEGWMKDSLRFLCRGRRVFQGNNLYSKGACFGILERMNSRKAERTHVFLGKDKLRVNIGMKLLRRGQESYLALLDAGNNWFEAERTIEFYIQDGNSVEILIMSLEGKGNKLAQIILEDLPEGLSRLKARFYMTLENRLAVEIEDLGLGEFRAATHQIWKEEVNIY